MFPGEFYGTLKGLTTADKLVLLYLVDRADKTRHAHPHRATIAADLTLGRNTVDRSLERLVGAGRLIPDGWGPGALGKRPRRYFVPWWSP